MEYDAPICCLGKDEEFPGPFIFKRLSEDYCIAGVFSNHFVDDHNRKVVRLMLFHSSGIEVGEGACGKGEEEYIVWPQHNEFHSYNYSPEALTVDKISHLSLTDRDGTVADCSLEIPDDIWQEHLIWEKKRNHIPLTEEEKVIDEKKQAEKKLNATISEAIKKFAKEEISSEDIRKCIVKPLADDYSAVGILYRSHKKDRRYSSGSIRKETNWFGSGVAIMKGDKVISLQSSIPYPDSGYSETYGGTTRGSYHRSLYTGDDCLEISDTGIKMVMNYLNDGERLKCLDSVWQRGDWYRYKVESDLTYPPEVLEALKRQAIENDLQKNMASPNPDRKKLRGHITRIHAEEQAVRDEVKKGIRSLAPEKEDPESPRYKRAQELKEQKRKYGSRTAIEADKTLKAQDDLGNQERKGMRKKLYERAQEAETLKAKRQAAAKKLSEPVSERDTEAQRIHGLRQDVEARQRDLEKAQEELQKAQSAYGDVRKQFKPKPKPQPVQPVQQPAVQSVPKPAPKPVSRSIWSRLFGRGGNGS